ncbi:MAG: hypothetical protein AB1733_01490 [Thermodesulfobacteriota bacterium]
MQKIRDKIERLLNAITFAEAGDYVAAREFLAQADSAETNEPGGERAENCVGLDPSSIREAQKELSQFDTVHFGAIKDALASLGDHKRLSAVLLATNGDYVQVKSLCYAVGLTKRLDAHLEILQVVGNPCESTTVRVTPRELTGTESTEISIHRLSEQELPCQVTLATGDFEDAIELYLKSKKHVVVIVYDSAGNSADTGSDEQRSRRFVEELSLRLAIPLVTVTTRR